MLGAGVLLFGAFYCSIYSSIGVILGSLCAFYIGRSVGYKTIAWFVGKKKIDKILNFVDGKDRLLFTFMFIFPMFPDDLLCFVAGLTKMSTKFFVKMIIVVRIIAISFACYSINNDLIPYNSSIGAIFWIIFLIFIIVSYFIIIKFCTKSKKSKN
ncbi:MAG: VTT domain-containing protein, partial [Clostridia bacterium]|nr:VTT domain-containing protein [Clostridia bacterium]